MTRAGLVFVFLFSLAGAVALWPEEQSHARAERLAVPLARELAALGALPQTLAHRLSSDPLLEMAAIWDDTGRFLTPVEPEVTRYRLTPPRLRALEALLAARANPVWARAPFADSDAVVRCQRGPDICIIFASGPLGARLQFSPLRLTRPLQGAFALGPALFLGTVAFGSGVTLLWRQSKRKRWM